MSDVTDADRERAFRVLGWHESWGLSDLNVDDRNEVEAIAAALAEERAKARAPFLALADEYDLIPIDDMEVRRFVRKTADRIRRAAEDAE